MSREDSRQASESVSQMIDERIREFGDWRGAVLKRIRALIQEACGGVNQAEVGKLLGWITAPSAGSASGCATEQRVKEDYGRLWKRLKGTLCQR